MIGSPRKITLERTEEFGNGLSDEIKDLKKESLSLHEQIELKDDMIRQLQLTLSDQQEDWNLKSSTNQTEFSKVKE